MLNSRQQAVQDYYEEQYQNAGTQSQRKKIIQEYVSRFPSLAFRADSWFFVLYRSWRGSNHAQDRAMLHVMARALTSDTNYLGGPVDDAALRRIKLAQAQAALVKVKKNARIRRAYKTWSEGKRDPDYDKFLREVVIETARSLDVAVRQGADGNVEFGAKVSEVNPYNAIFRALESTVRTKGLAAGLRATIAKLRGVRARDLHNLHSPRSARRRLHKRT